MIFEPIHKKHFDRSMIIPTSEIPFDKEVRKLCEQNMCGKFGTSWTCPPAVETIEALQMRIKEYNHFLIFYKVYSLEDSFDWEGMINSVRDFQSKVNRIKKEIKDIDPGFDFIVLGAGACQVCDTCTYMQQKPCRFPKDALFSIEAFGIDAMKMMKDSGLNYNNGPNTVTYIGGIIFS